jgi:hypothetical protein
MDASSSSARSVVVLVVSLLVAVLAPPGTALAAGLTSVTGPLKVKVGIADQKAGIFGDARLRALHLGYARRSVAWDTLRSPSATADLDAWVAGARAIGAEPLLTFARSSGRGGRKPPTPAAFLAQFLRFRARYPTITTYSAWNEANQCGVGTCHSPALVARYFDLIRHHCRGCKVVAADLLDQPNMVSWARAFRRAAKVEPRYWGLHDYIDANRSQTTRTKALLRAVPGEVWLTEVGGLVARRNKSTIKLPQGKVHAANATRFIFDRLARVSRRVTRIYLYHWSTVTAHDTWDSAFIGSDGVARPALAVLQARLSAIRAAGG